jgi:hypothetical protein
MAVLDLIYRLSVMEQTYGSSSLRLLVAMLVRVQIVFVSWESAIMLCTLDKHGGPRFAGEGR